MSIIRSIAIVLGPSGSSNGNGNSSGSVDRNPLAIWVAKYRTRSSPDDPHRYQLEYFTLDDDTQWTHLDALLLRYLPSSQAQSHDHDNEQEGLTASSSSASSSPLSSSSSSKTTNNICVGCSREESKRDEKTNRRYQHLLTFLEQRLAENDIIIEEKNNKNNNTKNQSPSMGRLSILSSLSFSSMMNKSKLEDAMMQLLLPSEHLSYRANVQLSENKLLQQGLIAWMQFESICATTTTLTTTTKMSSNHNFDDDDDDEWYHSTSLHVGRLQSCLVLDRTAAACVHLLPPPNAGIATVVGGTVHTNSLWGFLSQQCSTKMGKILLQTWLRQPLIDKSKIQYRQDAVTTLVQGLGKDSMKEALDAINVDLVQLANRLNQYASSQIVPKQKKQKKTMNHYNDDDDVENPNGQSSSSSSSSVGMTAAQTQSALKAMYQLYLLASQQLPQLAEGLTSFDTTSSPLLQDETKRINQLLSELDRCQGLVEAVLDLNMAPRDYLVKPTFSEELQGLHDELQQLRDQVDDEMNVVQELWNDISGGSAGDVAAGQVIRLEALDDDSWQFRLPQSNAVKVLESMEGIKLHRILKNGVYFSSKTLRALSTHHKTLKQDYAQQSRQVVQDAMEVAVTYVTVVERATESVATLDVLTALARIAAYSPHGYCKPELTDSDEDGAGIELKEARHPCVELQEDIEYIPNDVNLKLGMSSLTSTDDATSARKDAMDSANFMILTGPNMGGKSTYIRALGAIVVLAQIGSYVPASAAKINICHSLLARVGAGDLQDRGISTFMAEMLEASSILRTATKRSLIIIDELGRGTSTFDGYGLARAISEYLQQKIGCMTVFATHFHELTHMKGVQNRHVTAQQLQSQNNKDETGLTFLYQVREGPCLESFGIQVAEMARVPSVVIQDAKRKAAALEDFGSSKRQKVAFVERFRSLDLPTLLKEGDRGPETKANLLRLLAQ